MKHHTIYDIVTSKEIVMNKELTQRYLKLKHEISQYNTKLADCNKIIEEFNTFLSVLFPDEQLMIMPYNRVVKDLNGMSEVEFLQALEADFTVEDMGTEIYHPEALHVFALYLGGHWYKLVAKEGRYDDQDPIGVLDVTISSNLILDKLLGIKDLRSDKRIDFVGGIRGLQELSDRVNSGEMQMALALYPVTMKQLIDIADTGNIMPPKTTWFEPKLRSGLIIHELV